MFDGWQHPWAADPSLEPVELDPADPINDGLLLWLPLTEAATPRDGDITARDLSPFRRHGTYVNPQSPTNKKIGRMYVGGDPNELITIGPRDLSTGSDLGLAGRTANMAVSLWVSLASSSLAGVFFKIGNGSDGWGIGVGSGNADTSGNNLIGLYANKRWLDTATAIGTGEHHIVMSVDASGYPSIYLDGRPVYSDTTGVPYGIGTAGTSYCTINNEWNLGRFVGAAYQNVRFFGRPLLRGDALRLYDDRWCGAVSPVARLYSVALKAPTSSGIAGTLSATLAAATLSSTGALAIAGALAKTLSPATLSATGALPIVGALSATLAAATVASAGKVAIAGALAQTLAPATLSAAGALPIVGTLSATLSGATLSATGALPIVGALGVTLSPATLAATGALDVISTTGSLAVTLAAATVASTGTLAIAGAAAISLAPATLSAAGRLPIVGALAVTLSPATVAAYGLAGSPVPGPIVTLPARAWTVTLPRRDWTIDLASRAWTITLPRR